MGPGEWIAVASIIGAVLVAFLTGILGAAWWAVWHMSRLNTSVQNLTSELQQFRQFVEQEHRDMWAAINRKVDKD